MTAQPQEIKPWQIWQAPNGHYEIVLYKQEVSWVTSCGCDYHNHGLNDTHEEVDFNVFKYIGDVKDLLCQLASRDRTIANLEKKLRDLDHLNGDLREEISEHNQDKQYLHAEITVKDQTIQQQAKEIERLRSDCSFAEKITVERERRIFELCKDVDKQTEKIEELAEENSDLRAHHHDAEQAFDLYSKAQQQIADLQAKLEKTEGACRKLRDADSELDSAEAAIKMGEAIQLAKVALADPPAKDSCCWTEDENGCWNTSCGNTFEFNAGTPAENRATYCIYCGRTLEQMPAKESKTTTKPTGQWKCRVCGKVWNGSMLYLSPIHIEQVWTCADLLCGGTCDPCPPAKEGGQT